MTEQMLARARSGDEAAFGELVAPHRRELQLHCYRILGSLQDAEDTLQETLLAAWRGLEDFEGRASLRAWLYRIATNRCLNALRDRRRRPSPSEPMVELPEPTRRGEPIWLEPYPDVLLDGVPSTAPGPDVRYETVEAVGLAFIAALQRLPPRQRVVLVLCDVLGYHRAEAAAMLDTTEASVKAGLQRARATLDAGRPAPNRGGAPLPRSPREREVVGRFVAALENGDIGGVVALLTDDAWLTMPPEPHEYQGPAAIAAFLRHRAPLLGGRLRLVATRVNGQPAFGCYLPDSQSGIAQSYGMTVLALEGDLVSAITWFGERGLFPRLGLPRRLDRLS
ncbi:RNA polymerase subunit sigma-70 [Dactylosporangium roseum]|uniref:RNA polymerase subunit sigma-70 n=1 Tax=Dactylosporangium roseum TaxID=47989 RepID=A0ABY5ZFB8_9ACTN|nr:RNA polymerase subunit sigma-70 [Dactylosporangium roseum]